MGKKYLNLKKILKMSNSQKMKILNKKKINKENIEIKSEEIKQLKYKILNNKVKTKYSIIILYLS